MACLLSGVRKLLHPTIIQQALACREPQLQPSRSCTDLVYNRENRLKVAQDEEKHRKQEEAVRQAHIKAEKEHRRHLLLQRAHGEDPLNSDAGQLPNQQLAAPAEPRLEHINFWKDEEAKLQHPEVVEEKKQELRDRGNPDYFTVDAKFDERFKFAYNMTNDKPWYAQAIKHEPGQQPQAQKQLAAAVNTSEEHHSTTATTQGVVAVPLHGGSTMSLTRQDLKVLKAAAKALQSSKYERSVTSSSSSSGSDSDSSGSKRKKRKRRSSKSKRSSNNKPHKHKDRQHKKPKQKDGDELKGRFQVPAGKLDLECLRRERLERERVEKEKAQRVLLGAMDQ